MEVDNLGFNLYRDEGGRLTLVNPQLLAGSALVVGPVTLGAGRSYAWFDDAADGGAVYWLEDIDTNGKSAWHGPFAATRSEAQPDRSRVTHCRAPRGLVSSHSTGTHGRRTQRKDRSAFAATVR